MYTGYGIVVYPNGKKYEGDIRSGKRHGHGTMTLANRICYHGSWVDDVRHGVHHVTFPSSIHVTERWNRGVRHSVTIHYTNGTMYEGVCKDNSIIPHGQGIMNYTNGSIYHGTFVNGEQHGPGSMTYRGGNVFHGSWNHGVEEGPGRWCFTNGCTLQGKWKKGARLGKAVTLMIHGESMIVMSDWSEERDGHVYENGTVTYSSGKRYTGNLRDGVPHGKGVMYYVHGDVVDTTWNNGRIVHGQTSS